MKSASNALVTLLNGSDTFRIADLLTVTLVGGTVLRWTSADFDVTSGGNTFLSARDAIAPPWARSKTRTVVGVEVDTMQLQIFPNTTHLVNGQAISAAAKEGAFDGATVQLERVFMPTWGDTSAGTIVQFSGRVAEITELGRTKITMDVKSDLELLNVATPPNLYQPGCIHSLFDAGCALTKGSFVSASAATAGTTRSVVNCNLAQSAGYFDQGTITFTSGPNNGVSRTVKGYTAGVLTLIFPLPSVPAVGNTFNAYPGCDKKQATCTTKFSNLVNFRGFPYIPVPETLL